MKRLSFLPKNETVRPRSRIAAKPHVMCPRRVLPDFQATDYVVPLYGEFVILAFHGHDRLLDGPVHFIVPFKRDMAHGICDGLGLICYLDEKLSGSALSWSGVAENIVHICAFPPPPRNARWGHFPILRRSVRFSEGIIATLCSRSDRPLKNLLPTPRDI